MTEQPEEPNAVEAEQQIIGAILLEPGVMPELLQTGLKPEHFYDEVYRAAWAGGVEAWRNHSTVSSALLVHAMRASGVTSEVVGTTLSTCINATFTVIGVTAHAQLVLRAHQKREIGREAQRLIRDAYEGDDPARIAAQSRSRLSAIVAETDYGLRQATGQIPEAATGAEWGIDVLDRHTRGIVPGELTVVAGGTGQGKTNLALHVVRKMCEQGGRVAVYTLEMAQWEYESRLIHGLAQVRHRNTRDAPPHSKEELNELESAAGRLGEWNLLISDRGHLGLEEVEVTAEIASPLDLIVIDYLQLMDYGGGRESEASKIGAITRGLKQLSRTVGCHVLLVSQFNRTSSSVARDPRGPRLECGISGQRYPRPSMHNLLGSGSIEQDADKVILLQDHNFVDVKECQGHIELVLDKNRAGETAHGTLRRRFEMSLFSELEYDPPAIDWERSDGR